MVDWAAYHIQSSPHIARSDHQVFRGTPWASCVRNSHSLVFDLTKLPRNLLFHSFFMAYQGYHQQSSYGPPPPHNSYYPPPPPQHQYHQQQQQPPQYPVEPSVEHFRMDYAGRLSQLTFNSRPIIQDLSIIAMQERDKRSMAKMQVIVQEIEAALQRVSHKSSRWKSKEMIANSLLLGPANSQTSHFVSGRFNFEECRSTIHHRAHALRHPSHVLDRLQGSRRSHKGEIGGNGQFMANHRSRRR